MKKEIISGIYCIENTVTGKKYIGSSKNIFKRLKDHMYKLKKNVHPNKHLQSSFNKYNIENFSYKIFRYRW